MVPMPYPPLGGEHNGVLKNIYIYLKNLTMEINDMIGNRHRLNQAQLDRIAEIVKSNGEYKASNIYVNAKQRFAYLTHGALKGSLESNKQDRRTYLLNQLETSGIQIQAVVRKIKNKQ